MKLHLDSAAFRVLIESIHQKTGYREDVLEKDYYVTLVLKELADSSKRRGFRHISKVAQRCIRL